MLRPAGTGSQSLPELGAILRNSMPGIGQAGDTLSKTLKQTTDNIQFEPGWYKSSTKESSPASHLIFTCPCPERYPLHTSWLRPPWHLQRWRWPFTATAAALRQRGGPFLQWRARRACRVRDNKARRGCPFSRGACGVLLPDHSLTRHGGARPAAAACLPRQHSGCFRRLPLRGKLGALRAKAQVMDVCEQN